MTLFGFKNKLIHWEVVQWFIVQGQNKFLKTSTLPDTETFSHQQYLLLFKTLLDKWSDENFIPISKHATLFEELHFLTPGEETQN